jgi:hypothetical protein
MIWVNGVLVYNVFDGLAGSFGVDIAPFLVPGNNLIAAFADDNFFFGHNHQFTAQVTIETGTTAAVPEPSAVVLLGSGLSVLVAMRLRRSRRQPRGGRPV